MLRTLATATALSLSLAAFATAEEITWMATLEQAQEVKKDTEVPDAKGTAEGTLNTETGAMTYAISFEGLSGDATGMHFHGPAAAGAEAGVILDLGADGLTPPLSGEATLTAEQIQQVTDGLWYVNVHTAANPGGEIRGQVALAQ